MTGERGKDWGLAFHIHHNKLLELCHDYQQRVQAIKYHKPPHEQPIRLRLFQIVKGELPAELVRAGDAYHNTLQAYGKAEWTYRLEEDAYDGARRHAQMHLLKTPPRPEALEKASEAYQKVDGQTEGAFLALRNAIKKHQAAIEALHAQECPDCPWDGGKIVFPEEVEK